MPENTDPQKVTVFGRLSFAHIFKPHINKKVANAKAKFSVNVIMDPKTPEGKASIAAVKNAIKAAGHDKWGKWPHAKLVDTETGDPVDVKRFCLVKGSSFKDDDGNVRPECQGMWVLKASSNEDSPPVTVDSDGRSPLTGKDGKLYAGSYAKVGVRIYGTENGGLGVFAALNAAMFKKHGDPLGGGAPARAEDYFEAEEPGLDEDEQEETPAPKKSKRTVSDDDDL